MEEDLKILESIVKVHNDFLKGCNKEIISEKEIQALENLLTRYKQLEKENIHWRVQYHLLSRKINVIQVSKVKEKIEEIEQEDLEIYDTDSEDLVVAKYEYRAVLDTLQELLREE